MADKSSFILYNDMWDSIEELDHEQRGILFTAIYALSVEGVEIPEMDKSTRIIYKMIRNQLHRDASKYEQLIEKRRAAGKKGGEARAERLNQNKEKSTDSEANEANAIFAQANVADTVTVTDTDTVTVNDTETVSVSVNDTEYHEDQTDGQTEDLLTLGVNKNVHITRGQLMEIRRNYQESNRLIDKVSLWLKNAKNPNQDHMQLIYKFAVNDSWPKKPEPEPPPYELNPPAEFVEAPNEVKEKLKKMLI